MGCGEAIKKRLPPSKSSSLEQWIKKKNGMRSVVSRKNKKKRGGGGGGRLLDSTAPLDPENVGCVHPIAAQSYILMLASFGHRDKEMCQGHSHAVLTSYESCDVNKL